MSSSAKRDSKSLASPATNSITKSQELKPKSSSLQLKHSMPSSLSFQKSTWMARTPIRSTTICAWTALCTTLRTRLQLRFHGTLPSSSLTLKARSCHTMAHVTIRSRSKRRSRKCCEDWCPHFLCELCICISQAKPPLVKVLSQSHPMARPYLIPKALASVQRYAGVSP